MPAPTFYQHLMKATILSPVGDQHVEINARTADNLWTVYQDGQYQSARGKWHAPSTRESFIKTHTFPYEEALRRARELVGDPHAVPVPTRVMVSVSPEPVVGDLLSADIMLPGWSDGKYYASTAFGRPLDADGRQWVSETSWRLQPDDMSEYLVSQQEAFRRAIAYLKRANINGMTIYNTGSAVLAPK